MTKLITAPNVARPDDIYQWLIDLHEDLTDDESMEANARLVLLLVNHIGDEQVIRKAIEAARQGITSRTRGASQRQQHQQADVQPLMTSPPGDWVLWV